MYLLLFAYCSGEIAEQLLKCLCSCVVVKLVFDSSVIIYDYIVVA